MKTAPTRVSALPRPPPRCTAATSTPMAIANAAGSTPRRMSTTHHAIARKRSAFGRAPKKIHSLRAVSFPITVRVSQTLGGRVSQKRESISVRGLRASYPVSNFGWTASRCLLNVARSATESLERVLLVAAPRVNLGRSMRKTALIATVLILLQISLVALVLVQQETWGGPDTDEAAG